MPISFACPTCSAAIKVPHAAAGRRGECPTRQAAVYVPAPVPAAGPPPVPRNRVESVEPEPVELALAG